MSVEAPVYNPKDYPIPEQFATAEAILPEDSDEAILIGRVHMPGIGPRVVTVRDDKVVDITNAVKSVSDLCDAKNPLEVVRKAPGASIGTLDEILANTPPAVRDETKPYFLPPVDAQPVMAAGVTYVPSLIGRLIEEYAVGDAKASADAEEKIARIVGRTKEIAKVDDLAKVVPGTEKALAVVAYLVKEEGLSPHYLNVGFGPLAEIFTKAHAFGSVGTLDVGGYHPLDSWTNPEPEGASVINSRGEEIGAALSNDINGRQIEGQSALLVSAMKGTNRSSVIGPFIRLYDDTFTPEVFRNMRIGLDVMGPDGATVLGADEVKSYSIAQFSREVEDVIAQMVRNGSFPDGAILSLGTGLSLKGPRDPQDPSRGFFHKKGDITRIWSKELGALVHSVGPSDELPYHRYGIRAFAEAAVGQARAEAHQHLVDVLKESGLPNGDRIQVLGHFDDLQRGFHPN